MKQIFFTLLFIFNFNLQAADKDSVIKEYLEIYHSILQDLPLEIILPHNKTLLLNELLILENQTQYSATDELWFNGINVSATNSRGAFFEIQISMSEWIKLSYESKKALILHEQLSLAGIDDKNYEASGFLYDRLTQGKAINDEYLMDNISKCDQKALKQISRIDIDKSIPAHLKKITIYVAISQGCLPYLALIKDWNWNILDMAPDVWTFNKNSKQSDLVKNRISSLLIETKNSKIPLPQSQNSGNGGGQETNGGNGMVAEYFSIYHSIIKSMPRLIQLDSGVVLQRDHLQKPSINKILTHTDWALKDAISKTHMVIADVLAKDGIAPLVFSSAINKTITTSKKELKSDVGNCHIIKLSFLKRSDLLNTLTRIDLEDLLITAIKSNCDEFINLWNEWGLKTNYCKSPLAAAIESRSFLMVKKLLSVGADPLFLCRGEPQLCQLAQGNPDISEILKCND